LVSMEIENDKYLINWLNSFNTVCFNMTPRIDFRGVFFVYYYCGCDGVGEGKRI